MQNDKNKLVKSTQFGEVFHSTSYFIARISFESQIYVIAEWFESWQNLRSTERAHQRRFVILTISVAFEHPKKEISTFFRCFQMTNCRIVLPDFECIKTTSVALFQREWFNSKVYLLSIRCIDNIDAISTWQIIIWEIWWCLNVEKWDFKNNAHNNHRFYLQ